MKRSTIFAILILGLVLATAVPSHAVVRTPRQMNFLELSVAYNQAWGTYNGVPTYEFITDRHYEARGGDLYKGSPSFGIHYGRIAQGKLAMSLGFRYTHEVFKDTVDLKYLGRPTDKYLDLVGFHLNLYEGDINLNYYLSDINAASFSPYLGLGVLAGISSWHAEGYDSQNDFSSALSLNFGADFVLYRNANDGSFMTLASINSWNIVASNDRPKNLTIGGGFRYYFRM